MGTIIKALTTDMGRDELRPQIRRWVNQDRKQYPPIYKQFLNVDNINELYVEDMELGGFGSFPRLDEGDYLNILAPTTGAKTRFQPDEFQAAFAITRKDKRFNKIMKVERYIRMLRRAQKATEERIAATPLNLGFSSTLPGNDNKSLFATDHTNPNGDTVANRPASDVDLTVASLEAALVSFALMVGPDGNPIDVAPRYLVVHPSEGPNARRIVGSENYFTGGVPSAADTGVKNIIKQAGLIVVEDPYLTDPDAWFLIAEKGEHEIWVITNQPLEDYDFEDPWTRDYIYSLSFSMIAGFSSYLGSYGSTGA